MALFAAMTLVGIMNGQVPFAHLINATFGTHVHHFRLGACQRCAGDHPDDGGDGVAGLGREQRFVMRHLVGQEPIILFMATIGLGLFP